MLIHSDPNNMNPIVYHLIIERYSMKTLHWYFPWATALHLYNMTGRGKKLQQLHCYHPFSDSLDIYLTKNHYENYSPKMVPIAKIWGSGSWTITDVSELWRVIYGSQRVISGCLRLTAIWRSVRNHKKNPCMWTRYNGDLHKMISGAKKSSLVMAKLHIYIYITYAYIVYWKHQCELQLPPLSLFIWPNLQVVVTFTVLRQLQSRYLDMV